MLLSPLITVFLCGLILAPWAPWSHLCTCLGASHVKLDSPGVVLSVKYDLGRFALGSYMPLLEKLEGCPLLFIVCLPKWRNQMGINRRARSNIQTHLGWKANCKRGSLLACVWWANKLDVTWMCTTSTCLERRQPDALQGVFPCHSEGQRRGWLTSMPIWTRELVLSITSHFLLFSSFLWINYTY